MARKRARLSQEALAELVGAGGEASGRSTVSNWETGKFIPDGRFLLKLPDVLGVSAETTNVSFNPCGITPPEK